MFSASIAPDAIGERSSRGAIRQRKWRRLPSGGTNFVNILTVLNEMLFVKRRKMLMISYEDEIDAKSHRKQTRRRRRHATANEDRFRLNASLKMNSSTRLDSEERNSSNTNNNSMQRRWRATASLLVLMLTLPMVMQTEALLNEGQPSAWPVSATSGGLNDGDSDSFGSRLAANMRLDEAETIGAVDQSTFMSRQGQLGDGELQVAAARRQARQPAAPIQMQQQSRQPQMPAQPRPRQAVPPLGALPPNGFALQGGTNLNQEQLQERFQRLRQTPAQNFEQFPRPQGGAAPSFGLAPSGNQFAPPQLQPQQNQRLALGAPTLSAFDLSSLANLANNQPNGQNQQQPAQLQPTFRRIPPQPPREQQAVQVAPPQPTRLGGGGPPQVGQFFDAQNQNDRRQLQQQQQQQQQQQPNQPTELPFIRQVFRPEDQTATPVEPARNQAAPGGGGRPTPPPLFVPPRQQLGTNQQPQQQQQRRPFESGFSPMQSNRLATPTQFDTPAFFEPSGPQTRPSPGPVQANQSQPLARQQSPPASTGNDLQPGQRKPARRPSQRPHVPTPATNASATNQQLLRQQVAADVIRLAANAVQAANEGLAATGGALQTSGLSLGGGQEFAATATTTTTTAATTTSEATTTSGSAATTAASADLGRRAVSQPQPPRTSANFFQTLASTSSMPSSSFSPALPINQAVGATGGRRRIPVRVNSGRTPQATTPLTPPSSSQQQASTTTAAPSTSPALLRFQSTARENVGVRRPEIEDFYETIGGGPAGLSSVSGLSDGSPSTTTQIDGFGVPSRPKQAAAVAREPSESSNSVSTSTTDPADRATTTDMYGSRLPAGQAQEPNRANQWDQSAPPATPPQAKPADFEASLQDRRPVAASASSADRSAASSGAQRQQQAEANRQQQPAVMVPVTYVTTLTYLTTVLHGTHTLETSHETIEKSTRMATMNAQLINQIEHKMPLVEPTATVSLSSRVKGKGTTLINLKSAVSAYNQELVEALNAASGGLSTVPPQIQPTEVAATAGATSNVALQSVESPPDSSPRRGRPAQQRPSRTVDMRDLQELKKRLATEYIYSFTMRPVGQPDQLLATSVRSELVVGSQLVPDQQGERLMLMAAAANQAAEPNGQGNSLNLIDSDGLLRVAMPNGLVGNAAGTSQINLGSTIGRDTPQTMTEVNMEMATYLKFDGISNVMLELKPTALSAFESERPPLELPAGPAQNLAGKSQLDTSFNVHLTLGNALDQLQAQPAASQQTPALESVSPTRSQTNGRPELDLLRSSAVSSPPAPTASDQQQPNQSSASSNLVRSQLRSRVASSRFRSQFQTLQPARSSAVEPALVVSSSSVVASDSVAPSVGARRPIKSRILRPNLLKPSTLAQAVEQPSSSLSADLISSSAATSPVVPSSTRSTKARFVVVTRTGQFGIRASAISSALANSASESAESVASPVQSVRVSSRFSKPNRFGGGSRSAQVTRVRPGGEPLQTAAPPAAGRATQLESSSAAPIDTTTPLASTSKPTTSGPANEEPAANRPEAAAAAASVIVTYFTTTTHTIPFELNSETVFTTIEETNSRIATEYMSDLSSHFIEPTPVANLPVISQTVPPASINLPAGSTEATTTTTTTAAAATTTTTTTTAATSSENPTEKTPDEAGDKPRAGEKQLIEPSFATTLKTQTHFTTFTYFTTYSAGSESQTVQSSESTTSNVVVQTISSQIEPSATALNQIEATSLATLQEPAGTQPDAVTKTLLSTMTYYGTVYNGTQTSLTPIIDVSTRLLTVDANGNSLGSPSPAFTYVNSDLLAPSSTLAPSVRPSESATLSPSGDSTTSSGDSSRSPTPPLELSPTNQQQVVDRITRTKSMYTTLTHFITFYSGTKTQLSTIQEISPTVVTEYIDRTAFEQQQAEAASSISSSAVLVTIPSSSILSSGPPEAIMTTTTTTTTSTTTAPIENETGTSSTAAGAASSELDQTSSEASTTTTTSSTTSSEKNSASTSGEIPTTTTTIATTTTTTPQPQPELGSVSVSAPGGPQTAENQQRQPAQDAAKVLASSDPSAADTSSVEPKQATNIIELSDLIASNSSQSGRVALAGNLGAAIKDIVQLLAGNKSQLAHASDGGANSDKLPINLASLPTTSETAATTATSGASQQQDQTQATTSSTAAVSSSSPSRPSSSGSQKPRLFGNKQRGQSELQGSITSPATPTSSTASTETSDGNSARSGGNSVQQVRATPELNLQPASKANQAAATIFFGDDSNDERKKQIKTVWPGAQSTVFVTSIEPSTRSLTVTTTKVYYTRDSQLTITSSYVSTIAPRTFVSTIMGTRTLVNQLNGPASTATVQAETSRVSSSSSPPPPSPTRPADTQNAAVANRYKQQKKEQQQVAQEQRKLQQQAAAAAAKQQQQQLAKAKLEQQQLAMANINQCQPSCKASLNEICRFTPALASDGQTLQSGAQGSFACACRPGYYMQLNSVGQRQCQEVQSYVIMLRLLQVGDQQISFKRELQQRSSPEFKQYARIVREHVKRAYMTSDLIRDRYVGSDILNFARTLSVSSNVASQSMGAQPSQGKQPLALNVSQLDPLNAGVIVNMTIYLQQPQAPSGNTSNDIQLDETLLKDELAKKLNMRQAAALAAAAANAASASAGGSPSAQQPEIGGAPSNGTAAQVAGSQAEPTALTGANQTETSEPLPNPNALFLADVEQVQDLDECANPMLNDCHEGAVCVNEPGSYKCDCREYPDLNPLNPGRQCANELKSCDFCNNRGDCLRVPSMISMMSANSSSNTSQLGNGRGQPFSTICQCHRIYLGRRCEINGLLLATLLPILAILMIISVCLVIYCCRRWRRRSSLSKGFRNIGSFGPNIIGSTLDRKAMLESSSESSDTHQRHQAAGHQHHLLANGHPHHHQHQLRNGGLANSQTGGPSSLALYEASSDPSSSQESSPRQMTSSTRTGELNSASSYLHHLTPPSAAAAAAAAAGQANSLNPYSSSIPPQIVIPRARHNQVNYAVHRGQVYMW